MTQRAPHIPTNAPPPGSPCSYCAEKRPSALQLAGEATIDASGSVQYATRAICASCLILAYDRVFRPVVEVPS